MINQERDPIERIRKLLLSHEIATEKDLKVSLNFSVIRWCFKFSFKEEKKKDRLREKNRFCVIWSSGYWEGNEKKSRWSHCSSQGNTCNYYLANLTTIWLTSLIHSNPAFFIAISFVFPGKSNARCVRTFHKRVRERIWNWGNVFHLPSTEITRRKPISLECNLNTQTVFSCLYRCLEQTEKKSGVFFHK